MELQKTVKAQAEAWTRKTPPLAVLVRPVEVQVAVHVGRSFAAQILDEEPPRLSRGCSSRRGENFSFFR